MARSSRDRRRPRVREKHRPRRLKLRQLRQRHGAGRVESVELWWDPPQV